MWKCRAVRCIECRPAAEREAHRKATKKNKKWRRASGKYCSRCCKPTGKPGICRKCSAYVLKWKRENKDKVNATRNKRASEHRDRKGVLKRKLLEKQRGQCAMCGKKDAAWHLDHIIPRALGGSEEEFNFQVLCAFCNASKGAKIIDPSHNPTQIRLLP